MLNSLFTEIAKNKVKDHHIEMYNVNSILNSNKSNIKSLIYLSIPISEYLAFEYNYKVPKYIEHALKYFEFVNRKLVDFDYEIIDNGVIIKNRFIEPSYLRSFKRCLVIKM